MPVCEQKISCRVRDLDCGADAAFSNEVSRGDLRIAKINHSAAAMALASALASVEWGKCFMYAPLAFMR